MGVGTHYRWGPFYVQERVVPFIGRAVDTSNLTTGGGARGGRGMRPDRGGRPDTGDAPSRFHGDL